jgi:hypothetical protein
MLHAYCWPPSARPGDAVGLRVSADEGDAGAPFEVEVAREGARREVVWTGRGVAEHLPIPAEASANGCAWPDALQIPIGEWRSGYYSVTVASGRRRADAFLVVRPDPAEPAPIVLVLATCTWNAYNDWGGPSLYTGGTRVSFDRPLAPGFLVKPGGARRKMQPHPDREALWFFEWAEPLGISVWSGGAGWWNWERPFLRWAEANGFRVDVAVQEDLELHPEVLDGARLYLSVGHDEYWSWGMRDAVEAFAASGRNVAFFGGNTCYWQVRFEDDHRTMVGYKYGAEADPVLGTPDERLLTSAWVDRRIGRPEFSTTGLSFSRGGYSRYGLGVPRSSGAYTVWRPEHWVFEGTDLAYGDALGLADAIVAYEVDGCELEMDRGLAVPTHRDGAPDTLEVLASAPAHLWTQAEQPSRYSHEPGELESVAMAIHGDAWRDHLDELRHNHAVVGVFEAPGGGTVFNGGCTDWAYGLSGTDPILDQVTANVLRRLCG